MTDPILQLALDLATRYRERVASVPVFPRVTVDDLRKALGGPLPERGTDAAKVITDLVKGAEPGLVASTGPRYFGFVIGGSLPVTTAVDWLVSTWDQNSGIYAVSPAAAVVEEVAAGWLTELFGLPSTVSVGFVTSGGTANFTALAAARHGVLQKVGWDVEDKGLIGAPKVNVVISDQSHITILTALRMLGLGAGGVLRVPTDDQGRMIAAELKKVLATCAGPTIVCAQVGNVNSGACDPIDNIVTLAHAQGAWVHVDGAFGLWATVSPGLQPLVRGIEQADSWSVDAHKWLNVPYDCGLALCAHPDAHRGAMSLHAEYLVQSEGKERDNFDWAPEFSRRARGFTVYAAIQHLGRSGIREMVERCCARARQFAALLTHARVKVLNDVVLNQVLVRFGDSDDLTQQVIKRVQDEGVCWMSGTTWQGKAAMRISVSNWSTTEQDIARSAASVIKAVGAPIG